ncbi:CVNH domain-containing protein [Cystobacter fuscus]|uniref:mannose-binding lectin n=1 Tax=Cystobacter fuscus TaxID=43 RepID=UPI0037BE6C30
MMTLPNSDKSSIRWMNPVAGLLTGMVLALAQAGCGGPADQDNEGLAHTEQALRGDFSQSCTNIWFFNDHYLSASCARATGEYVYSEIDLGEYLVNSNGDVWWGLGGQFHKTCSLVAFGRTDSELVFSCKKEDGSYKETRKELDERIANINGVLTYRP